ncbi:MAG: sporulation protein [Zymomonas mobilis]|uniref:Flp pilus assembly protein TadD n=1 Tax=Zymomonas mobilis TaxID=542 RepID=A0A542W0X2_ZYMMB|nr:sporulation protein [Zymomonas mobilis]TQL17230.1 Flp pilus assembly protein TadD [Zymomonas mobilis]
MNAFLKITTIASTFVLGATLCSADIVSDRFSAVTSAEQAFRQQPDNSEAQFKLGRAYLMAGRYISAWQCLNKLVAREPSNDKARLYMALAAIGTNNKNAAQRILAPITKVSPVDLGLALALAGEPTEAIAKMEPLLSSPSNSARLRQNLAFAYVMAERWNDGSKMAGQDLPADQVNARLTQWSRITREKNGALQLQAFIGVPPAKDYGFLSPAQATTTAAVSVTSPKTVAAVAPPPLMPSPATASSPVTVTPSTAQQKPAIIPTQQPVILAKPTEVAPAPQGSTQPAALPAPVTTTPSNPSAPSTIAEIDLPSSAQNAVPAEKPVTNNDTHRSNSDDPVIAPIAAEKEKTTPRSQITQTEIATKKPLNLPMKEILAENSKKTNPSKPVSLPSSNPTDRKDTPLKDKLALKEAAYSKKEDKLIGQDCPSSISTTQSCHMVTSPAVQLATHKLPISPAVTDQSNKMLRTIQAKWPVAAKYKIITYSESGSPVYRLLLTGFSSAKEAQESCNALMQKEIPCVPSSYKTAVRSPKINKKTK